MPTKTPAPRTTLTDAAVARATVPLVSLRAGAHAKTSVHVIELTRDTLIAANACGRAALLPAIVLQRAFRIHVLLPTSFTNEPRWASTSGDNTMLNGGWRGVQAIPKHRALRQ